VGRIGSGVRVSVSFQHKYLSGSVIQCPTAAKNGVMTKEGFDLPLSPAYNVEPVTNMLSSSCANNGRRGECSTFDAVRRGFVFALRDSYG